LIVVVSYPVQDVPSVLTVNISMRHRSESQNERIDIRLMIYRYTCEIIPSNRRMLLWMPSFCRSSWSSGKLSDYRWDVSRWR
jgi:hypothetical protein